MSDSSSSKPWGCLAAFDSPERLLAAARAAHTAGYRRMEAYTPLPVEGLEEALGRSEHSWVPWLMLLGAILGGVFGYWIQWYTAVVDFPINVGGRPLNSWPAFLVITFEFTILGSALAGFIGWMALCRLPQPYHPVFNATGFDLASRNRFFLCIEASDPAFDLTRTSDFLLSQQALEVAEVTP